MSTTGFQPIGAGYDPFPTGGSSSNGLASLFGGSLSALGPWGMGAGLGLGLLGSFMGMNQQNQSSQQLSQLLNQLMGNETQVQNQVEQGIGNLDQQAGYYTGILPRLSSAQSANLAGPGSMAAPAGLQFMLNSMSPSALQSTTGVNQLAPTQQLLQYLSNPNATRVGKIDPNIIKQLTHGDISKFFKGEMAHGLSPQVQTNAMNQLQQQFQQSLSNINANATPGQNLNAAQQAAQNQLLQSGANQSAQLALESQQMKQQGAQGLQGSLQQALQSAQLSDQQKQQMLQQAFQTALGYNQTALGNEQSAAGFGQNVLSGLTNFAGQGMQAQEYGLGTLASLFNSLASQTSGIAGAAMSANQQSSQNNPFSFLSSLGGLF